ncbi:MAG TPA: DUF447 domain-containing protein [Gemmataceae bacterium]|jgi:hypothetical protein|nr:DUF447 domain-containing protein [Gemmataceae bacterium]
MILEGIVTTLTADGRAHIAAMGPEVDSSFERLVLKPFQTSQTYLNLTRHPEGVVHITDDVLLLAQAAIGQIDPIPPTAPTHKTRGFYLCGCCRYLEFRIVAVDRSQPRARLEAEVVHQAGLRDFFGLNRGKHAVVEAAILATRMHLLPLSEIASEYDRLEVLVQKTGGPGEHQAFRLLRSHLVHALKEREDTSAADPKGPELTVWQGKQE